MHILFLPAWFETPAHPTSGRAIKDLVFALTRYSLVQEAGHKFHILFQSFESVPEVQYLNHDIEVWHSRDSTRGKLFPGWNIFSLRRYLKLLDQYILKHGTPDLLHIHSYSALPAAVHILKKRKIPFVYTEHSSNVAQDKLSAIERRLIRSYSKQAMKIIAVGTYLANKLSSIVDRAVQMIPNTIDFNLFTPEGHKNPGQWIMINLLNKNKQVDLGIKAFDQYAQNNKKAMLHIIGDGPERIFLEKLIHSISSGDRIKMYGELQVDAWLPILKSSIGLLFMSRFETFGVVALEALACNVPVISLENNGITDLVNPDDIIILPTGADIQNVANAMTSVVSGQTSPVSLRNRLASKFDYPQIAQLYLQVYHESINIFSH